MTISELKKNKLILFEAITGSRAYGLATETSDTDIKGVFYLPKDQYYGLNYVAQVNDEANNEVYYELGRFVELLTKNNPNILELLASPAECVLIRNPIMEQFRIEELISIDTAKAFTEYAMVQVRKSKGLNKKMNNPMDEERKSLLDFCFILSGNESLSLKVWLTKNEFDQRKCGLAKIDHTKGMFSLFYDDHDKYEYRGIVAKEDNQEVSLSSISKGETMKAYLFVNQEAYSMYCKSYHEYFDWVKKRNEVRFSNTLSHGQGYDAKNMMHTLRLLEVAKEILLTGRLNVKRSNRDFLLKVKAGQFSYEELYELAEKMTEEIDLLSTNFSCKRTVDNGQLECLLVDMRKELYH